MIKRYGIRGIFSLFISYIFTKIFYRKSRIIRLPFDIRNKNCIDLGENLTTGNSCRIEAYPVNIADQNKKILIFGKNIQINDYVHISAGLKVSIGDNVLIASKVFISDISHGSYSGDELDSSPKSIPQERLLYAKEIKIEENVWIGEFVSVLPGVTIGKGSIIGSNSVVSRDIPPNVIAVGTPAKPIKKYNFISEKWEKIQ
ncbi:Putative acetyltransferase [Chryseobacterium aquaeductus]|uniref:Acetyltransferase n=1 Tax=Chryseobacterium aquaeductus TaxID=2675056 RepID=A0A9N8MI50_9FLAO|nr:DapH/DapD/GlmU-related protein [Chryseobacterium aquaeductus]CAA7331608.1 Putative acetyltransferase [Chryseobacterium potabilaquae]CAD7811224.1 Putative acetyltransferase [Chryseobacterium aquaeductus]